MIMTGAGNAYMIPLRNVTSDWRLSVSLFDVKFRSAEGGYFVTPSYFSSIYLFLFIYLEMQFMGKVQ